MGLITIAVHDLQVVVQPGEGVLLWITCPVANIAITAAQPPFAAGALVVALCECVDPVDGTVVLPELALGDDDLLLSDRIEDVEFPGLLVIV
jgi:hypothetical protein